ncbi:MAG: hypothetical protein U0704_08990 [Candidatus Eisenbacteria bacterium]
MILLLRLLAECTDAEVTALAERYVAATRKWRGTRVGAPERSASWPELVEFTLALAPPDDATFDSVLAVAREGWTHGGDADDRSSVWNRMPGAELLVPETRWAELLRHRGVHEAG